MLGVILTASAKSQALVVGGGWEKFMGKEDNFLITNGIRLSIVFFARPSFFAKGRIRWEKF
jgi:hypothetical protein